MEGADRHHIQKCPNLSVHVKILDEMYQPEHDFVLITIIVERQMQIRQIIWVRMSRQKGQGVFKCPEFLIRSHMMISLQRPNGFFRCPIFCQTGTSFLREA